MGGPSPPLSTYVDTVIVILFTLTFSRNDARTVNVMATACVSPVTKVRWGHMPMCTFYGTLKFGRNVWREAR